MKRHLPFLILAAVVYLLVYGAALLRAPGDPDLIDLGQGQEARLQLAWKVAGRFFGFLEVEEDYYWEGEHHTDVYFVLFYGFNETETYYWEGEYYSLTSQFLYYEGPAWPGLLVLTVLPLALIYILRRPIWRAVTSWRRTKPTADP